MSINKIKELRDDLNAVAHQLAAADEGAAAPEIAATLMKERPLLVQAASDWLIMNSLTRLVSDVVRRRVDKGIDIDQPNFFEQLITDMIPVPSASSGAGRRIRYRIAGKLRLGFAEQVVKHHLDGRRRKADKFDFYKQVIDYVRQYVTSDDLTLDEALAAARAAEAKKLASGGGKP